ncbi:Protein phosphatase [Ceratobasidium theobromae]|uniref:protein-serine/threonine phosphatase n=1 Tax=Ceratobasidium theobromae TaxID=1582974 RepID=A0A5N5QB43_9AGAM|nr:Protein phosphatase [Ceratobasidium theobromae]
MGQTLSEPVTTKNSDSGGDERYMYGVSEMQGWRISMEDAHATVLKLDPHSGNAFFAVFDGHGGSTIAKYAGSHVHERLRSDAGYQSKDYKAALKRAFLGTDDDLRADPAFFHDPSGCTAVAALLTEDKILVANAGDSRSVMSVKGVVKELSFDHKPQNPCAYASFFASRAHFPLAETSRITAAGGYVEYNRVNGNLALSRAIGDFEFKQNYAIQPEQQIVTANPDITEHDVTEEDEFIVLACDGIWDCLTSQQVIDCVRRLVAQRKDLGEICEIIMDRCVAPDSDIGAGIGCDNMTIMVVALLNGRTKDAWYDWMADRVERKWGHETPEELPQLYSEARIAAARNRAAGRGPPAGLPSAGLNMLQRILSSAGGQGITGGPLSGGLASRLAFDADSSDEEMDDDDSTPGAAGKLFGNRTRGLGEEDEDELMKDGSGSGQRKDLDSLKAQLDELTDGLEDEVKEAEEDKASGQGVKPEVDPISPVEDEKDAQLTTQPNGYGLSSKPPTAIGSPLVPTPQVLRDHVRTPSPNLTSTTGS